jgi:NosR/NirI family nitrous oxide reductase transcriptional regulator
VIRNAARAWRWLAGPARLAAAITLMLALGLAGSQRAEAAGNLERLIGKASLAEVFPGADRLGPVEGSPPAAGAYAGDKLLGYVFLNSDLVDATGYSGKPINILIGLGLDGKIAGARLVEHHEPIVLVGIPQSRIDKVIAGYAGLDVLNPAALGHESRKIDIVSGATVTVMIIDDSITRAAVKFAQARGIGGAAAPALAAPQVTKTLDLEQGGIEGWIDLLGDGSVRRLQLTVGDVNRAFEASGNPDAAARPEEGAPEETFIDLYAALVSTPVIGRSLLGEAAHQQLKAQLKPGQQAVLIAARGRYSFKGSGYVRGGIFDRVQLVQGETSIRFRDKNHTRIGDLAAAGAPQIQEIGVFAVPEAQTLDPAQPWRLELLVQRATGPTAKAFLTYSLTYILPDKYLKTVAPAAPPAAAPPATTDTGATAEEATAPERAHEERAALWQRIWKERAVDIAVLVAALGALTLIFFFQDWLVRRPRLAVWVRDGFLAFTVLWIGVYAHAQLSVVNVLTFSSAVMTEFRWDYFLMDPLLFILWCSVAGSLLFWGRGGYCGWLCPFGAAQELINKGAKLLRVPQLKMPWGLHERLWPVKYIIFVALFGASLYSLGLGERLSEVEPFKTAVIMQFSRGWPFVLWAALMLGSSLFVERFFCRYICPLGGALAIPGRLRMFEWLKRHKECGSPCQICAKECMVNAIHPDGHINPNECLYCLHCQIVYYDDHKCPPMVQRRLKRERREALGSKDFSLPPPPARGKAAARPKPSKDAADQPVAAAPTATAGEPA